MTEFYDPIAAFGSIEEGNDPLWPYIDPMVFATIDKEAQMKLLAPAFDAITLAGADYDLQVEDGEAGKRYTLLKNEKVLNVLLMDSDFTDQVIEGINRKQEDSE